MNIGLARRGYSPSGGAERYLKRFGEALANAGHETVLFASPEWPRAEWLHGEVCPVAGDSPRKYADALKDAKPADRCDFLFSLERVWGCDCYRAGDGVHQFWLQRREAYEPRWRASTRFFNRKHNEILQLEKRMFSPDSTGRVIVNSRMVRQEIIEFYGYPEDRIEVVYNGVPRRSFERCPERGGRTRHDIGLYDTELMVLFAGSGWDRKGLRFAIDAVESLPKELHARLVVAGKGNRMKYHSSKTIFLGPVPDVMPYLEAADVFVLPTTYDPFSNACLEAMAAGLPVVTSPTNGFAEIVVQGVDGHVLEAPEDVEGIAKAIIDWSDPERRKEAAPRIAAKAAKYNVTANLNSTLAVIERQLADRK